MGAIKTTLEQLTSVLPQNPEFQTLTQAAVTIETYSDNLIANQKQMLTEMNDKMMTTYADSMAMYDQMLTRIQEQFASVNKTAPLASNASEAAQD